MDYKDFKNPDNKFAPTPFWSINDKLNVEETKRQMADLVEKGFGGGFFHARHGLITEYMGEEWFDSVKGAVEEAKEVGGYLWLYDEDLWPSGNAGGRVAGLKDEYRAAMITAELVPIGDSPVESNNPVLCTYKLNGRKGDPVVISDALTLGNAEDNIDSFEIISYETAKADVSYERMVIRLAYAPKIGWWSGESYANLLSEEAMDEFIKQTHEIYKKEIGEDFGGTVPGIFTDEPQIVTGFNCIAWWNGLPEKYKETYNRNFWDDLPYMFFNHAKAYEARLFICRTILKQFTTAFSKKMYDWCEDNNLALTGHYNAEDTFEDQLKCHYGGIMAHYKYNQIPGVDHLCRQVNGIWGEYVSSYLTVKQASSAAHQYGRNQVLSEIWGVTRHTNTFAEFKWMGDGELALGATFFVPHLTWYSMRGRRKRDYPPVFNYQQTYWEDMKPLMNYFTRISNVLSNAKPKVDIMVLHTVESAVAIRKFGFKPDPKCHYVMYGMETEALQHDNLPTDLNEEIYCGVRALDSYFRTTVKAITDMGYECDFGDENYIEEIGSVKGDKFIIGEMEYKVVVVPSAITFRKSTCDKLIEFAKNGGKVILVGQMPTLVDGVYAENNITKLINMDTVTICPMSKVQVQHTVNKVYSGNYKLSSLDGKPVTETLVSTKTDGANDIYFIVNSSKDDDKSYSLRLKDAADKNIYILDAIKGEVYKTSGIKSGKDLIFTFDLNKCGSILLNITGEKVVSKEIFNPNTLINNEPDFKIENITDLNGVYDYKLSDDNIAVLDIVKYSTNDGATWSDYTKEAFARVQLAKHFKTERALEWQNWVCDVKGEFNGLGGKVRIKYFLQSDISKTAKVAFESLNLGEAFLNGEKLNFDNDMWKYDRTFKTAEVNVKAGENVFEHVFDYNYKSDVEAIYVYGDFGVRLVDNKLACITDKPKQITNGSWKDQGFPFYIGNITYISKVNINAKHAMLRLNNANGIIFKVKVNDKYVDTIWLSPNQLDISDYIQNGENKIEVEVVSSLQNAFGPLHDKQGDDNEWVHVDAYENPQVVLDNYVLYDYGILDGITVLTDK